MLKLMGQSEFAFGVLKTVAPDRKNWTRDIDALYEARKTLGHKIHDLNISKGI